jgi:hypothetical protein
VQFACRVADAQMIVHVDEPGQEGHIAKVESLVAGLRGRVSSGAYPPNPILPDEDGCILQQGGSGAIE